MKLVASILLGVFLVGCGNSAGAMEILPAKLPSEIPAQTAAPAPAAVDTTQKPVTVIVAGFGASLHGDAFGGCEAKAAQNFEKLLRAAQKKGIKVAFTKLPCGNAPWNVGPLHMFGAIQKRLGIPDERLLGFNWMRRLADPTDVTQVINPTVQTNTVLELDKRLSDVNDGGPVNVIAHSFGAIAIDYCRQVGYCAMVQRIVRLGPPVRGSIGGYFLLNGEVRGNFLSAWSGEVLLEYMKAGLHHGLISDTNFVRTYIPSVEQLLPIDPYIKRSVGWFGAVQKIPVQKTCFVNTFLQEFNELSHNSIPSLTLYGTKVPTLAVLRAYNTAHIMTNCQEQRWPDGAPGILGLGNNQDEYVDGDGTVTTASATALNVQEAAVPYGMHSTTLLTSEETLQRIAEFLDN